MFVFDAEFISILSQEQNQGDRGFKIQTGSSALLTRKTKRKVRRKTIKKNTRRRFVCFLHTLRNSPTDVYICRGKQSFESLWGDIREAGATVTPVQAASFS